MRYLSVVTLLSIILTFLNTICALPAHVHVPKIKPHTRTTPAHSIAQPTNTHSSTKTAAPPKQTHGHNDDAGRVLLGFNGFNGVPRTPQASLGGELGAVFYIADAVDLARLFANGADQSRSYICNITADSTEWSRVPKVWVPHSTLSLGGNAMNKQFPGSVVFADHAHPGFPDAPPAVHQMGIRQAQIARLHLQSVCLHVDKWKNNHQTLNYPHQTGWKIQTPEHP